MGEISGPGHEIGSVSARCSCQLGSTCRIRIVVRVEGNDRRLYCGAVSLASSHRTLGRHAAEGEQDDGRQNSQHDNDEKQFDEGEATAVLPRGIRIDCSDQR